MNIKIIATDLDQTLLMSDKSISDYTIKTLRACQQQGIKIAFATARSERDCVPYTSIINPDAIISNRGAIVRVGNDIISRTVIDAKTTNELLSSCVGKPGVGYIYVYTEKGYFTNSPAEKHDQSWGPYNHDLYIDFSKGLDYDSYKITVEFFDDAAAHNVANSFPNLSVVKFTGEPWFSFANSSVNKFNGIKILADYLNINLDDIAAFGDDYSDIEMLHKCGAGVAVNNAIDDAKAVAKYICDSNDCDGVAKWIEKNVLKCQTI